MADLKISQLTGATTPLAGTEVLPIVQSSTTKKVAVSDLTAGRAVSMGTAEVTGASTKLSAEVFRTSATSYMRIAGGSVAAAGAYALMFGETHATAPGRLSLNAAGAGYAELASGDGAYNLRLSSTGNATLSNGNLVQGTAAKGVNFTANTPAAGMTSQLLNWYEEGTFTPTIRGSSSAGTGTYTSQNGYYTRIGRQVTCIFWINWSAHTGTGNLQITGFPFTSANLANNYAIGVFGEVANLTVSANNVLDHFVLPPNSVIADVQQRPVGGVTDAAVAMDTAAYIEASITYFV